MWVCVYTEGDVMLEEHELVAEETGAPQQPCRRLQRTYAKTHHAKTNVIHLAVKNFTAKFHGGEELKGNDVGFGRNLKVICS